MFEYTFNLAESDETIYIHLLADRPEFVSIVATECFREWQHCLENDFDIHSGEEYAVDMRMNKLNRDSAPLILVAHTQQAGSKGAVGSRVLLACQSPAPCHATCTCQYAMTVRADGSVRASLPSVPCRHVGDGVSH